MHPEQRESVTEVTRTSGRRVALKLIKDEKVWHILSMHPNKVVQKRKMNTGIAWKSTSEMF